MGDEKLVPVKLTMTDLPDRRSRVEFIKVAGLQEFQRLCAEAAKEQRPQVSGASSTWLNRGKK